MNYHASTNKRPRSCERSRWGNASSSILITHTHFLQRRRYDGGLSSGKMLFYINASVTPNCKWIGHIPFGGTLRGWITPNHMSHSGYRTKFTVVKPTYHISLHPALCEFNISSYCRPVFRSGPLNLLFLFIVCFYLERSWKNSIKKGLYGTNWRRHSCCKVKLWWIVASLDSLISSLSTNRCSWWDATITPEGELFYEYYFYWWGDFERLSTQTNPW